MQSTDVRVAVCFYGQPRSLEFCAKANKEVFQNLQKDCTVDFFVHSWNVNTGGLGYDETEFLDGDLLSETFNKFYAPKRICIENPVEIIRFTDDSTVWRTSCHLYSLSQSIRCLEQYRMLHDVYYDYVFLLRTDQWFADGLFCKGFNLFDYLHSDAISLVGGDNLEEIVRDEGFGFNYETAIRFSLVFSYFLGGYRKWLTEDDYIPEVLITKFLERENIEREPKGLAWDRVTVRQPVDRMLNFDIPLHRRILKEIREWVDWVTKDPKLYSLYVDCRLSGMSERNSLEKLSEQSGIDFIQESEFEKELKFGSLE